MGKLPFTEVGQKAVRGGIEVIAYNRSNRGTRYFQDSIVILTDGLSVREIKEAVAAAILTLSGRPE